MGGILRAQLSVDLAMQREDRGIAYTKLALELQRRHARLDQIDGYDPGRQGFQEI